MARTSKSPQAVTLAAVAIARQSLPEYAHRYSPKKITQHQLFACLVLKKFLWTDYRGLAATSTLWRCNHKFWMCDYDLACSPKAEPCVMRVLRPLAGRGGLSMTTKRRKRHRLESSAARTRDSTQKVT